MGARIAVRAKLVLLVLLLMGPGRVVAAPGVGHTPHGIRTSDVAHVLPDSIRLRMLAALVRGDIESAIAMYQLHTGIQEVPKWLQAFQAAFSAANRVAGPCERVAEDVFEGFHKLGANPSYIRFTTLGEGPAANLIGFELRAGEPSSTVMITTQRFHYAVQVKDRIYDAFTGSGGLEWAEYVRRLAVHSPVKLTWEKVGHL